jgi:hypothetical protein
VNARVLAWLVPAATAAGFVLCWLLDLVPRVADWWRIRRGRPRVHAVIEDETRRHIGDLVPGQRRSSDPVWWEFVPQQQGGDY